MAKEKTLFACTGCGYETAKWVGKCPGCSAWNTMEEAAVITGTAGKNAKLAARQRPGTGAVPMLLSDIPEDVTRRISTGIGELDRVLGGSGPDNSGLVEGALMLIGGDPGVGKSTLLLQVCANLARAGKRVLYISGEESARQIKLRANRLGITKEPNLYILAENALDAVEEKLRHLPWERQPRRPPSSVRARALRPCCCGISPRMRPCVPPPASANWTGCWAAAWWRVR